MVGKCQLEVKITHSEMGREQALTSLVHCLDDQRFWGVLELAVQDAFRDSVKQITGETHNYQISVKEHDLLRHLREKEERYAKEDG